MGVDVGPGVPRGPPRDHRVRKVSLAFALVLLLLLAMVVLTTDYSELEDLEPADEIPDWLDPQPQVITSDEKWEGRREVMETPIIVRGGATLELVDCNLSVHFLDLVLGNQTWITVEEGGGLVLERTDLSVYYEPQIEDALAATGDSYSGTPFSISRVVNLEGAEDPVLSIDLMWCRGDTTVFVGAQGGVGEDLDLFSRIEPGNGTHRTWTNWKVPLADHRDRVVRLIVFTNESGFKDIVIGQVRVVDGTGDLPSDRFETGRAWEDGWLCRRFCPVLMPVYFGPSWTQTLIHSRGDLTVSDSHVHSPPGLPRRGISYATSRYHDEPAEPIDLTIRQNDEEATGGAHIQVVGAKLAVRSSTIQHTPIMVQHSEVLITDSELSGDADLLAFNASHGTIADCDLISLPYQPVQRTPYSDRTEKLERGLALSFNHTDGPMAIRGSVFRGSRICLDLNHAFVELEGCEFQGYTEMAVRDHDTTGLGSYADIASRNTIHPATGSRYFRTHTATFDLTGPGKPAPGRRYSLNTGLVSWEGVGGDERQDIVRVDAYQVHLLMPTFSVDASGTGRPIEEVSLDVHTSWGGAFDVELDTFLRGGTIELDPTLTDDFFFTGGRNSVSREEVYGGAPGLVDVSLDVQLREEYDDNWIMLLRFDDDLLDIVGADDADLPLYSTHAGYVNLTLDVQQGLHRLNYALVAQSAIDGSIEEVWNETVPYLRVDAEVDEGAVGPFVQMGNGTLLLDPGVHLVVDPFAPDPDRERRAIDLMLSNGSRFDLAEANLTPGTRLYINASGSGTVDLSGIETGSLYIRCDGVDVGVEDLDCERLRVWSYGGNVSLRRLEVANRTDLDVHGAEGFQVLDSDIEVRTSGWSTSVYAYASNLTVDNVTVRTQGASEFPIALLDRSSLALTDSTFERIVAGVYCGFWSESEVAFQVSGCEFTGSGAGLWIDDNAYGLTTLSFTNGSIVEANRFSGEGCSLACHFDLVDRVLGPNELDDGATFYAMYYLDVVLTDAPEAYRYISREFLLDEEQLALAEGLLGEEWDSWLPIFVEGAIPDMTVEDPDPVVLRLRTECSLPNHVSSYWVVGFADVDPTSPMNEVPVPHWERVDDVITDLVEAL